LTDKSERLDRLRVDIDTRLADVWAVAWNALDLTDETGGIVGALMRAAYGVGYRDAYQECEAGRPGELAVANGYTKEAGA
jgi:hypothetical protein